MPHARLRRASGHLQLRLPARRLASRGAGRAGAGAGARRDRAHRPQQLRRDRPGARSRPRSSGLRFLVGCRLDLADGTSLLCWPTDRPAYARLSSLLTHGKRRAAKGGCTLALDDVARPRRGAAVRAARRPRCRMRLSPSWRPAARALAAQPVSRPEPPLCAATTPRGSPGSRASRATPGAAARDQRRPLPPSRPAAAAGRAHLHPRAARIAGRGAAPVRQRRAAPETAGRDGAAVRATARRRSRASLEIVERCRFSLRRAGLRLPDPRLLRRPHAATRSWRGAPGRAPRERYPDQLPEKVDAADPARARADRASCATRPTS